MALEKVAEKAEIIKNVNIFGRGKLQNDPAYTFCWLDSVNSYFKSLNYLD